RTDQPRAAEHRAVAAEREEDVDQRAIVEELGARDARRDRLLAHQRHVERRRASREAAQDGRESLVAEVPDHAHARGHPATASLACSARTRAAIPPASSPVHWSCTWRGACSMTRSGTPCTLTRTAGSIPSMTAAIAAPKPFTTVPSSTVRMRWCD